MAAYAQPESVEEATMLLADGGWVMLAGGTDFYPSLGEEPMRRDVLDMSHIKELRGVAKTADGWRIGALCTWSDLIRTELPPAFNALKQAAREVGSIQIQNRATIVGNICNASPAADGVPALLILDCVVELVSTRGVRTVALNEFIQGNRKIARNHDELVSAIFVPDSATKGQSGFFKLGARKYLVISIAMIAARLDINTDGVVSEAAISVGACSEVAQRLALLEAELIGKPVATFVDIPSLAHLDCLSPIDDVRAPASYRKGAVLEGIRRAISMCVEARS